MREVSGGGFELVQVVVSRHAASVRFDPGF
jgi:hypothetical protein